jgi:DNA-binding NtrC family response regulator
MTAAPATPPTVLCVDDDPDLLAAVTRILRLDGYRVVPADSPRAALAILSAEPVAVLVSDYEMPEMTGIELSVRARALQPETVRVMLTGRSTLDTAIDGINVAEVFRFLSKPFSPEMLRVEVAAAVAHHREIAAVVHERLTVVRRQRLAEALEADFPGITVIPRSEDGAYLLDGEARRGAAGAAMAPILALFERQP